MSLEVRVSRYNTMHLIVIILSFVVSAVSAATYSDVTVAEDLYSRATTFTNPIKLKDGSDPFMVRFFCISIRLFVSYL